MDDVDLLRAGFALIFVLGLIALIAWLARRLRLGGALGLQPGRHRLRLVEVAVIDPRHKMALVRRDDVEHLVLLGPSSPLILETMPARPSATRAGPDPEERA